MNDGKCLHVCDPNRPPCRPSKFISLQNKIKLYCPPFCVRYEISKENILQIPSVVLAFVLFCACQHRTFYFLSSYCELFFPTSKEKKSSTLITFVFTTKAFETPLSFEISNQGGWEQLNTHFNELSSVFFLEFSFHKNVTHQRNLLLLFQFHCTQIFSFYLFISKVLSRILYSIFSFLSFTLTKDVGQMKFFRS